MTLSSIHLEAFSALARALNFSKAAQTIHITQSALSQRIKNLEEELNLTLFIRDPAGVRLTESGERLLRYCHIKNSLEEELIAELKQEKHGDLAGIIRLGAYSSVLRSAVIPAIAGLLRKHPKLQVDLQSVAIPDLPDLLQRSEFDFIIMDYKLERANIETRRLGYEENVAIEGRNHKSPDDVYLDNEASDRATEEFFRGQPGKPPKYKRAYFHDCYGIIDGVSQGLGRAVMPRHLVEKNEAIRVLPGFKRQRLEVTLHFYAQPFYSRIATALIRELEERMPKFLST